MSVSPIAERTKAVPRKLRSGIEKARWRSMESVAEVGVGRRSLLLRLLARHGDLSFLDHLEQLRIGEVEVRRDLLAERRLVEQLRQRRRGGAAGPAGVLDEHDDYHLGVVARRLGREPGMVGGEERQAGGAEPA